MTNMLDNGSLWLSEQTDRFMSSPITYIRKDGTQKVLNAVIAQSKRSTSYGPSMYDINEMSGLETGSPVSDFIVRKMAFPWEPQPGDVIKYGRSTFEVMEFGQAGCYSWCDTFHYQLRIHTRLTGEEE